MRLIPVIVRICTGQLLRTLCLLVMLHNASPERLLAQEKTVEEQNKKLVYIAIEEIGNKGNLDKIPDLYTDDFVRHFLPDDTQTKGLEEFRIRMAQLHVDFPDWAEEVRLIVAEKDLVAIWFTTSGTNTGSFLGNPPTGRKTVNNVMSFFRVVDKKIAEQWLLPDLFSMNSHLGLIPGKDAIEIDNKGVRQVPKLNGAIDSIHEQHHKNLALLANEQVWTLGNFEKLEEMFSDDFIQHFLPFGTHTEGLEVFRQQLIAHREAFPDWAEVVNLVVAEGDYIYLHFTSTGTNTGVFLGNPPTGKKININEVTIFRIADDKIAEQWLLPDILSLNQQLGLIPSAE